MLIYFYLVAYSLNFANKFYFIWYCLNLNGKLKMHLVNLSYFRYHQTKSQFKIIMSIVNVFVHPDYFTRLEKSTQQQPESINEQINFFASWQMAIENVTVQVRSLELKILLMTVKPCKINPD